MAKHCNDCLWLDQHDGCFLKQRRKPVCRKFEPLISAEEVEAVRKIDAAATVAVITVKQRERIAQQN